LVLCAGFIQSPRRDLLAHIATALAPGLFSFGMPRSVCRQFLVGPTAPVGFVNTVRATVSKVPGGVFAQIAEQQRCKQKRDDLPHIIAQSISGAQILIGEAIRRG
jgi:hypothetical protein